MARRAVFVSAFLALAFAFVPRFSAGQAAVSATVESKSCSVSCSTGYFACCTFDDFCECKENGTVVLCRHGGPGAVSCSQGKSVAAGLQDYQLDSLNEFLDTLEMNPTLDESQRSALEEFLASISEEVESCPE